MKQTSKALPAVITARPNHCRGRLAVATAALLALTLGAKAEVQTTIDYHMDDAESAAFSFAKVPPPSRNDAATTAKFTLVTGEPASTDITLDLLHDGKLPQQADEPQQNFFFVSGSAGGRIQVDLGSAKEIKQVNTYSWHPTTRGPQVYQLFASTGVAEGFVALPGKGVAPEACGWKHIAQVDTRPSRPNDSAQCGVSIADTAGAIGSYRYLLFDITPAEIDDDFGNTFYSEIDVVELNAPVQPALTGGVPPIVVPVADGSCEITIDTTKEPALGDWAEQQLAPALAQWYPKITAMLASDGYTAPKKFSVVLRPGDGVAYTSGTRIVANSVWIGGELKGEALGAIIHEVVHVVQQYEGGRHQAGHAPGWLVEGIPDYIRFFKYEPQSHGADQVWLEARRKMPLKYDGMYRISANFLDYVVTHHDPNQTLLLKVNAACRQGKYTEALWQELTGKTLAELNTEWKAAVRPQAANTQGAAGGI